MKYKNWNRATDSDTPASARDALNMTLNSPDGRFFISYMGNMDLARAKFGLKPSSKDVPHKSETALALRKGGILGLGQYFVLGGDHRDAYEARIGSFDDCLRYWAAAMVDNDEAKNTVPAIYCPRHRTLEAPAEHAAEIRAK